MYFRSCDAPCKHSSGQCPDIKQVSHPSNTSKFSPIEYLASYTWHKAFVFFQVSCKCYNFLSCPLKILVVAAPMSCISFVGKAFHALAPTVYKYLFFGRIINFYVLEQFIFIFYYTLYKLLRLGVDFYTELHPTTRYFSVDMPNSSL